MIINRYIIPVGIVVYLLISLCAVTGVHAAQQAVTTITPGTGTTGLSLKGYNDTYINPRLTNIQANDTDLYTNKVDKSCFANSTAFNACFALDWPTGFDTAGNYTVTGAWDFTGAAVTGIEGSLPTLTEGQIIIGGPGGAPAAIDVPEVTATEINTVLGITGISKYHGTNSSGVVGVYDLPAGGAGTGLEFLSSDPVSPTNNSAWYNTTNHQFKIATADGLWTDGTFAAWSAVNAFDFTDLTDQIADGLLKCSTAITPTGANHSWPVTVSGDAGCSVKIDGSVAATTGTYTPGDTIEVCVNASTSASTTTSCTPSIGAISSTSAFSVSTAAGASLLSVSENFNSGTNLASIDTLGKWTHKNEPDGAFADARYVSLQVAGTASRRSLAYWSADTFDPDQKSCMLVKVVGEGGPGVRFSSSTGYGGYYVASSGGNHALYKSGTVVATFGTQVADDAVCLSATGQAPVTVTVAINGVDQTSYVDSTSPLTSGQPGLYMNNNVYRGDDWTAEEL